VVRKKLSLRRRRVPSNRLPRHCELLPTRVQVKQSTKLIFC
jgi:hypothetical protein